MCEKCASRALLLSSLLLISMQMLVSSLPLWFACLGTISVLFSASPSRPSHLAASHALSLLGCVCGGEWSKRRGRRGTKGRQRFQMCALSERLLQAAEHYSLSPLHAVSAAVAAYAVKEGRKGGGLWPICVHTHQPEGGMNNRQFALKKKKRSYIFSDIFSDNAFNGFLSWSDNICLPGFSV